MPTAEKNRRTSYGWKSGRNWNGNFL